LDGNDGVEPADDFAEALPRYERNNDACSESDEIGLYVEQERYIRPT
jgi:hypothetical protein